MWLTPEPKGLMTLFLNLWFTVRFQQVRGLPETVCTAVCFEEGTFFLRWRFMISSS